MNSVTPDEFNEQYALEIIEPGRESYMLATVCATIHNEFASIRSLLTSTELRPEDWATAETYLPRLDEDSDEENAERNAESIRQFHEQAARMFG